MLYFVYKINRFFFVVFPRAVGEKCPESHILLVLTWCSKDGLMEGVPKYLLLSIMTKPFPSLGHKRRAEIGSNKSS